MPKKPFTKENAAELGAKGGAKNKGRVSPTTKAKQLAREALREHIENDMEELYTAWKDVAVGHFIQVKTAAGTTKVYKRSPNGNAIRDMFERAFGKPTQPVIVADPEDLSERAKAILHELDFELTDQEASEEDADGDVSEVDEAPRQGTRKRS